MTIIGIRMKRLSLMKRLVTRMKDGVYRNGGGEVNGEEWINGEICIPIINQTAGDSSCQT
jgi:hypothetical protein